MNKRGLTTGEWVMLAAAIIVTILVAIGIISTLK